MGTHPITTPLYHFHSGCSSHFSVQWVWKLYFWNYCYISQGAMRYKHSFSKMAKRGNMHNLLFKYCKRCCLTYNIDGKYGEKNHDLLFSHMIKYSPSLPCDINNITLVNDIVKPCCALFNSVYIIIFSRIRVKCLLIFSRYLSWHQITNLIG